MLNESSLSSFLYSSYSVVSWILKDIWELVKGKKYGKGMLMRLELIEELSFQWGGSFEETILI